MLGIGPRKTHVGISLFYPCSGAGFLFLLTLTGFLGLMRFITWLFSKGEPGLSGASVVIFALLGGAYVARYLAASVEATAEGYDLAPSPPDPREAETLFGTFLGLVVLLFFCLLPLGLASMFGVAGGPVTWILLGFATLYFPMGLLGVSVRGELTGCFPGRVIAGIAATFPRYLAAVLLCAACGFLLYLTYAGALADLPIVLLVALDFCVSWLLAAVTHRMGAMHREEYILQTLMPAPEPETVPTDAVLPSRPMTEIERILAERRKGEQASPSEFDS